MTALTIATWNVNSIKSRLAQALEYLQHTSPDIVLLQETKCVTEAFPYMEIEALGYNCAVHGQKTFNGVAVLSKFPIDDIAKALPGAPEDEQARYIEAVVSLPGKAVRVASVYVPNGQSPDSDKFQYKMQFLDRLHHHCQELLKYEEILVLGGDYNVAPYAEDVHDPLRLDGTVCYHPQERAKLRTLLHLGFTDAFRATNPTTHQFSWWDYRGASWEQNKGMRIDHLLLSPEAADRLTSCEIRSSLRSEEKASDHAPVECILAV